MKILIIDDAQYIRDNISILLGLEGYEVETANDGVEGVKKTFDVMPDLILCDISMPRMDGFEVLKTIRNNPKTASIPFIFLSAFANVREGMNLGSDDYIVKPFTRNVLLASIKARMERRRQETEKTRIQCNSFAENVATAMPHEFRTVLNEILNATNLIKECNRQKEYDSLEELTDVILLDICRMQKITDNFILMTQVQLYKRNMDNFVKFKEYRTENPDNLIKEVADAIATRRERKDDLIIKCVENDIKLAIFSEHFYKSCYEIIDNAFAFSDKGGKVTITTNTDAEQSLFTIDITDTGRGMSNTQINEIYAFNQFDRKEYEQQGIGLGMVLANELILLYGGKFDIKSEKNKGTVVQIKLPYEKIND